MWPWRWRDPNTVIHEAGDIGAPLWWASAPKKYKKWIEMAHFGNFDGYHVGDHNNTKPGRENAHPRQPREAEKTEKCSKDKDTFLDSWIYTHMQILQIIVPFSWFDSAFQLTSGVSNITQAVLVECAKVALLFCFPSNIFQHLPTSSNIFQHTSIVVHRFCLQRLCYHHGHHGHQGVGMAAARAFNCCATADTTRSLEWCRGTIQTYPDPLHWWGTF